MIAVTDPRSNNFNLLRLVAASSVIFSHAVDIVTGKPDGIESLIGHSGGWIAVSAFFSMSGFLIYRSIQRSANIMEYICARCLRILPGLWAMLLLTTLFLGVFLSSLPLSTYIVHTQTGGYILGNALLYWPNYLLPGVYETNPLQAVNGSIWTLRFEFTCYLLTLLLFLIGAYRSERAFLVLVGTTLIGYLGMIAAAASMGRLDSLLHDGSDIGKLHRLWFAFFIGIVIGRYVEILWFRFWMVALAVIVSIALFRTPLFETVLILSIGLAVFWFAFQQATWLAPFRRMHDYSYGIYIYAFPVQQAVVHLAPNLSPMGNAIVSLVVTVPIAALSWHWIEKPILAMKSFFIRKPRVEG
ncbi:MAG: acyltransferase [Cypionkella sp.]|uniref:acyltransferase family protein n=1 Tax=Cypionkella sp. TaxID=2811411 RepID=UPI002AB96A44|nr:acyltransferase [Cypionkella sp.]MDZ4309656.1 acyltransferase [Cypionkella sp.]